MVLGQNVYTGTKHDMKKLITSAGLVVLGAATLEAQQLYAPAPGLTTTELSKPWSVSGAIRGFYDDNYALTPSGGIPTAGGVIKPQSSYGFEVMPSAALNWTMEQTYIGLSYVYGLTYFEDRPGNKIDQSHQANVKLSHAFTDRYKLDIADSFVATKEPDLLAPNVSPNATIRTRQDMVRNYGSANFSAGLSDQLSVVLGYSNTFYDFSDSGPGSLSALLDRDEHLATANLRWQALPQTVALVGYSFGILDYSRANTDTMIFDPMIGRDLTSRERSSYSHYVYAGIDQSFNPQLDASVRVGAQITDYYNYPGNTDDHISPYADANLTYHVTPDSWIQVGVRHSMMATDGAALDQENTTAYGSVNYRVLPPLVASLLGQYQYNTFNQGYGEYAGKAENFYLVGLNLAYDFNKFLAAEVGYNYDRLDSDLAFRTFTRNRVYIGLRASY
jgi:hypothetical protein